MDSESTSAQLSERDVEAANEPRYQQPVTIEVPPAFSGDRRRFGIREFKRRSKDTITVSGSAGGDAFIGANDYDKKYPSDKYGEEMGPDARIWKIYVDEAAEDDRFLIENLRDTLDVILVFAGLFSAVVTTFVIHTVESLEEDWQTALVSLLSEQNCIQRSLAAGIPLDGCQTNADLENSIPSTSSTIDNAVNALFFVSLAVALCTALAAVLAKQWLHHYVQVVPGNPQDRARRHQFRQDGFKRYRVEFIVGLLPVLIHLSLFLFFIGLGIFLSSLDVLTTTLVSAIIGMTLAMYVSCNILPIVFIQCPYQTPVTIYIHSLLLFIHDKLIRRKNKPKTHKQLKEREGRLISTHGHYWDVRCLSWLQTATTDAKVHTAACCAFAGMPADFSDEAKAELKNSPVQSAAFTTQVHALLNETAQDGSTKDIARALASVGPLFPRGQEIEHEYRLWHNGPALSRVFEFIDKHRHLEDPASVSQNASLYSMVYSVSHWERVHYARRQEFGNFLITLVDCSPEFVAVDVWRHIFCLAYEWGSDMSSRLAVRSREPGYYVGAFDQATTFRFMIGLMDLFTHLEGIDQGKTKLNPQSQQLSEAIFSFVSRLLFISNENDWMAKMIWAETDSRKKWHLSKQMAWFHVLSHMPWPTTDKEAKMFDQVRFTTRCTVQAREEIRREFMVRPTIQEHLGTALSTSIRELLHNDCPIPPRVWIPMYDLVRQIHDDSGLDFAECHHALAELDRRKVEFLLRQDMGTGIPTDTPFGSGS